MGESMWVDLDAFQVQEIDNAMGENSAYASLRIQTVKAILIEEIEQWEDDSIWTLPAVAVMGRDQERVPGGHDGSGSLSFDKIYPYFWLSVTVGPQDTAMRDAKILGKRMETIARTMSTSGIAPDDTGEIVQGMYSVGGTRIMQYRRHSATDDNTWYVIASLAIGFDTTV